VMLENWQIMENIQEHLHNSKPMNMPRQF